MRDAGSAPARTAASPGLTPRAASALTLGPSAARTDAATAFPSISFAGMAYYKSPRFEIAQAKSPSRRKAMSAVPTNEPAANDPDSLETHEWLQALEAVIEREGPERAHFLIEKLTETARTNGVTLPYTPYTPYVNTIPAHMEERSPGDPALEERIRSYCRWNA